MAFMAAAIPYLAAGAAGMSAIGSYEQGQQAVAAGKYNANVEDMRATQALDASAAQGQIVGQETAEKIGAAGAAYGAGGVDVTGSPLEVMSSLATKGELNRRLTLYQGQSQAISDRNQAALDVAQGKAANQADLLKAGTTLLTGAVTAGMMAGSSPAAPSYTSPASYIGSSGLHMGGT